MGGDKQNVQSSALHILSFAQKKRAFRETQNSKGKKLPPSFSIGGRSAAFYVNNFNEVFAVVHVKEDAKIAKPAAVSGAFVGERRNITRKERVARHFFKHAHQTFPLVSWGAFDTFSRGLFRADFPKAMF